MKMELRYLRQARLVRVTRKALAAQTAWLKAHSEYIDAGIELQMLAANLNKAEGNNHAQTK